MSLQRCSLHQKQKSLFCLFLPQVEKKPRCSKSRNSLTVEDIEMWLGS